jgi:hypothetical protein
VDGEIYGENSFCSLKPVSVDSWALVELLSG